MIKAWLFVYIGEEEEPPEPPVGGENEWIVWDYSPSDPLTSDFLTTQIFK